MSEAGADIILVGDSVANTVLGYEDTLHVDIEVMAHHTAAVARARPRSLILGDMPWMSYHVVRGRRGAQCGDAGAGRGAGSEARGWAALVWASSRRSSGPRSR